MKLWEIKCDQLDGTIGNVDIFFRNGNILKAWTHRSSEKVRPTDLELSSSEETAERFGRNEPAVPNVNPRYTDLEQSSPEETAERFGRMNRGAERESAIYGS